MPYSCTRVRALPTKIKRTIITVPNCTWINRKFPVKVQERNARWRDECRSPNIDWVFTTGICKIDRIPVGVAVAVVENEFANSTPNAVDPSGMIGNEEKRIILRDADTWLGTARRINEPSITNLSDEAFTVMLISKFLAEDASCFYKRWVVIEACSVFSEEF